MDSFKIWPVNAQKTQYKLSRTEPAKKTLCRPKATHKYIEQHNNMLKLVLHAEKLGVTIFWLVQGT